MGIDFPNSPSAGDTYTYEGETYRYNGVAFVKVRDRVTTFNGATGAIIGVSSVNGLTGSVTLKPSGFEFEIISTTLSDLNDTIPSSGGIRLVRDYIGSTSIVFNRFDKQDNDLAFPQINLQNNGGTIIGISEDGEKFFHIVSPDRGTRIGHSFTIGTNNSVTPGKLTFQDSTNIPNDGSPDTGLIAMDSFSVGEKIFVQFIPNIAPPTTIDGVSGPIVLASTLELGGPSGATLDINVDNLAVVRSFNGATGAIIGVTSVQGKTGDVTLTDLEITHGVETFNGLSGSIDTTSLVLPVTGLSASGGITLSGDISIAGDIVSQDDNLAIRGPGGSEILMSFLGSQTIINNSATNQDIIVKGNGDSQLFVTDAGNNRVGIGTGTPTEKLDVTGTIKALGISGPSGITFSNGEVIRNSPDGSIQIIPSDEGGNHYGIEIDATEWGFGPAINVIDESGTQVSVAIRLDTDVVMSNTNVPDGTPARLLFNNASDRGFQQNNNGDGTVMFGVNGDNGHFAVGRKADLSDGDRSMSTSDKTALGMSDPQFLVYSADHTDANDYIRLEHDQTDANIFSGTGNINLVPAGGVVGVSGGTAEADNFVVDGGKIFQKGNESTTHIDMSSAQDVIIKAADDISLTPADAFRISHGNGVGDGVVFSAQTLNFLMSGAGGFLSVSDDMSNITLGDIDQFNSATKITLDDTGVIFTDESNNVVETIGSQYRRNDDVGTFTISASSAISTGAKTDALHRIPYNAKLTKFELKSKATGGMTAAIYIAGDDFGNPTSGFVTGATAETTGLTGETTTFGTTNVNKGDFVYLHVLANASGATAAQAFITYESR